MLSSAQMFTNGHSEKPKGFGFIEGLPVMEPLDDLPEIPVHVDEKPLTALEMDTLRVLRDLKGVINRPTVVYESKDASLFLDGIRKYRWEVVEQKRSGLFRVSHGLECWNICLYKLVDGRIVLRYWRGGEQGVLNPPMLTGMLEEFKRMSNTVEEPIVVEDGHRRQ